MGIVFNEIADASVKESIRKGEEVQHLIPVSDLKSYWKMNLRVAARNGTENQENRKDGSTLRTTTKTMENLR
jgi:hypothetical protein